MPTLANFVRSELAVAINAAATTIRVTHASPYNRFPDPGGDIAYAILVDNIRQPTKFEIVTYTGISVIDASTTELTGVSRAQDGTTAESFSVGADVSQDIVAANLGILELQDNQPLIYVGSRDTNARQYNQDLSLGYVFSVPEDWVYSIDVAADGTMYCGLEDGTVYAVDQDGGVLWSNTDSSDRVTAITALSGGGVIWTNGPPSAAPTITRADEAGGIEWSVTVSAGGSSNISAIKERPDGMFWALRPSGNASLVFDGNGYMALDVFTSEAALMLSDGGIFGPNPFANELRFYDAFGNQTKAISFTMQEVYSACQLPDGNIVFDRVDSGAMPTRSIVKLLTDDTIDPSFEIDLTDAAGGTIEMHCDIYGNIYAARADRRIWKWDSDGNLLGKTPAANSPVNDFALSMKPRNLFVQGGGAPTLSPIQYGDIANKPTDQGIQTIRSIPDVPETPPSNKCVVWFDGADLTVKFDDGTTSVIASKTP